MNENDKTTVYLLGDSITQGLGSKKINFTAELACLLGKDYEIVNLAYTGTTIDFSEVRSRYVRRNLRQR